MSKNCTKFTFTCHTICLSYLSLCCISSYRVVQSKNRSYLKSNHMNLFTQNATGYTSSSSINNEFLKLFLYLYFICNARPPWFEIIIHFFASAKGQRVYFFLNENPCVCVCFVSIMRAMHNFLFPFLFFVSHFVWFSRTFIALHIWECVIYWIERKKTIQKCNYAVQYTHFM